MDINKDDDYILKNNIDITHDNINVLYNNNKYSADLIAYLTKEDLLENNILSNILTVNNDVNIILKKKIFNEKLSDLVDINIYDNKIISIIFDDKNNVIISINNNENIKICNDLSKQTRNNKDIDNQDIFNLSVNYLDPNIHVCKYCQKIFISKDTMILHQKKHRLYTNRIKCAVCNKQIRTIKLLRIHLSKNKNCKK